MKMKDWNEIDVHVDRQIEIEMMSECVITLTIDDSTTGLESIVRLPERGSLSFRQSIINCQINHSLGPLLTFSSNSSALHRTSSLLSRIRFRISLLWQFHGESILLLLTSQSNPSSPLPPHLVHDISTGWISSHHPCITSVIPHQTIPMPYSKTRPRSSAQQSPFGCPWNSCEKVLACGSLPLHDSLEESDRVPLSFSKQLGSMILTLRANKF